MTIRPLAAGDRPQDLTEVVGVSVSIFYPHFPASGRSALSANSAHGGRAPGAPGPWPLLLEFWMGIGIFMLTERLTFLLRARGNWGLIIAGAGFALLLVPRLTSYNPDDYQSVGRVLCWRFPAALIIIGLIVAEKGGIAIRNRLVLLLGAASYSIYLLHPIAIGQLIQIAPQTPPVSWTIWALAIGATVGISVGFHLLVEVPTLRRLRAFIRDPLPIEKRASTL